MADTRIKPICWVGSSKRSLKAFPPEVQAAFGFALFRAQQGKKAHSAKPLREIVRGAGVLEIVEDFQADSFRAIYTVDFADAIYVLHAFQKKSKTGIATPKQEMSLIRNRYALATAHYEENRR